MLYHNNLFSKILNLRKGETSDAKGNATVNATGSTRKVIQDTDKKRIYSERRSCIQS